MPRPKLPRTQVRSEKVFVSLRPKERRLLERLKKRQKKPGGTILRDAFCQVYGIEDA